MRWSILLAFALGCGSYWDLRKGLSINQGCDSLLVYYADLDEDGWGDPQSEGVEACEQDAQAAANNLDCDDSDPNVGLPLEICPAEISDGLGVEAATRAGFEYVAVLPPGTPLRAQAAEAECKRWAGESSADVAPGNRGLAIIDDPSELSDLEVLLGDGEWIYVGAGWDPEAETWRWRDGSGIIGQLPYCNNDEPDLLDVNPTLLQGNLSDDELDSLIESTRLAIRKDGAGYCLGMPEQSSGENTYRLAYFLCERPAANPADYQQVPSSEG